MSTTIKSWPDVAPTYDTDAHLLVGNGFSINLHSHFAYASLLDEAEIDDPLPDLFQKLASNDFEYVMQALATARTVSETFGHPTSSEYDAVYSELRQSLLDAVKKVHPVLGGAGLHDLGTKKRMAGFYNASRIYTTNYDLLLYWQLCAYHEAHPGEYTWADGFKPADDDGLRYHGDPDNPGPDVPGNKRNALLYLHGSLVLAQDPVSGQPRKATRPTDTDLLDSLSDFWSRYPPLFVSEGSSQDKLQRIQSNNYLATCYEALRLDTSPLIILGSRMGEQDQHIIDAVKTGRHWDRPKIAISVHETDKTPDDELEAEVDRLQSALGRGVEFFRADTHPMLSPVPPLTKLLTLP